MTLRAPFPWFGGKSRCAHLVWPRFGDVANYIEPFAGSLAVLLARPEEYPPRVETANDIDAYLCNFWRAVQHDPEAVAAHADWPVNEADLHARHRWLVSTAGKRMRKLRYNPHYYDPKVAGWWVWGQCLWIGSGWCARPEWSGRMNAGRWSRGVHTDKYAQRPDVSSTNGRGLLAPEFSRMRMGNVLEQDRRPQLSNDNGLIGASGWEKRPEMKRGGGRGVHAHSVRRPNMGGAGAGQGVHAPTLTKQQVPDLSGSRGASGRGIHATAFELKSEGLFNYILALQARLRRVRVCCGDWQRVLTPAVTTYIGLTGVLLDAPYRQDLRSICYSHDHNISTEVRAWALEHGEDPQFRIALCGYEDEHAEHMPSTWEMVPWKAGGGYGRSERGKQNRHEERIWFSPHCLPDVPPLFAGTEWMGVEL